MWRYGKMESLLISEVEEIAAVVLVAEEMKARMEEELVLGEEWGGRVYADRNCRQGGVKKFL
jgi:hypothetical protein